PTSIEAPAIPAARSARELDGCIRALSAELARRDLTMGAMFQRFREADGWRRLGWATEKQYVEERVGVSHASMKARLTLARRCRRLPAVAQALEAGHIGFEAASLVARVASPQTVERWIARARERTIQHLREEIEGVEMLARARGDASELVPPDEQLVAALAEAERWVLTGGVLRGEEPPGLPARQLAGDSQMSGDGQIPRDDRRPE